MRKLLLLLALSACDPGPPTITQTVIDVNADLVCKLSDLVVFSGRVVKPSSNETFEEDLSTLQDILGSYTGKDGIECVIGR